MNIIWLINYHTPEHDRTKCKYDVTSNTCFFQYICTLKPQSLSAVASVHCFSAEGLYFSALVFIVSVSVEIKELQLPEELRQNDKSTNKQTNKQKNL